MKTVYVFGHGDYYETKKDALLSRYKVAAFIDNAAVLKEEAMNPPVYRPEHIAELPMYPVVVMGYRRNFCDMVAQLLKLGVAEERIILGQNLEPAADAGEELFHLAGGLKLCAGRFEFGLRGTRYSFSSWEEYRSLLFTLLQKENQDIGGIGRLQINPVSRAFGLERGRAIDRYYIERFLKDNRRLITGVVGEFGDDTYTRQFGCDVTESLVFHLRDRSSVIPLNLESGAGVKEEMVDCLICTQTIQMIYDLPAVAANIYKMLKPKGAALVTASGISPISRTDDAQWGEYWRFTVQSMRRLFEKDFGCDNVSVVSYGNAKTASAFLYGLCQEDLEEEDFLYEDGQYAVTIGVVCVKRNA